MQDPADSEYYWTIKIGSGEPYYLADNDGNRIKATSTVHDGQTPQLGVKQWETSDGATITITGRKRLEPVQRHGLKRMERK